MPLAEYAIEIDQDLILTFQLSDEDADAIEGEVAVEAPVLTGLAPATAVAGSAATTVSVNGTGFTTYSRIVVNGKIVYPIYVSSTQLRCTVTPGKTAAVFPVTVSNSSAKSNSLNFTVTATQE